MPRRPYSRLGAALLLSLIWPGLGSFLVGQPFLGLVLMAGALASLLATMLFYGYVTTPLVWLFGLVAVAVGHRRRELGKPQWPARSFRTFLTLAVLAVGGLAAFHLAWRAPKAPGPALARRGGPPPGPSPEQVVWNGPEGQRSVDPQASPSLTANELGHLRWWTAVATQPLGRWDGFYSIDQFGQTALRYQIAFAAYALAQAQVARLPAYRGPFEGALSDLVAKMLHPDVWGYWKWEAMAGLTGLGQDPVAEGNAMYSGHLASAAGLARLISGRPLYEEAGSLAFVRDDKAVASYSYRTLLDRLARQFRTNPGHAITCEPNQAFVMCNNHAALGLLLGSRLLGDQGLADAVSYYKEAYSEIFRRLRDGPTLRYPYYPPIGKTLPFHLVLGDGWAIATLNGLMPEEARRQYEGYRQRVFGSSPEGPRGVPLSPFYERLDVGNMRLSAASQAAFAMLAAAEMGEADKAREMLSTVESRYGPRWHGGRRTYQDLSPLLHAVVLLARFTPPGGIRALFLEARPSEAWKRPHLAHVEGGELDVVQAVYRPEEEVLLLGLVAGESEGKRTLVVGGLEPARRYTLVANGRVAGAGISPSPDGTLRVPVAGDEAVRCVLAANPARP